VLAAARLGRLRLRILLNMAAMIHHTLEDAQSLASAGRRPLGSLAAQNPLLGADGTSTHSDCMGVGQLHGTGHVEVNDRTTPPILSRSQQELYWRRKEEHRKRWGDRYRLPESF